MERVGSGGGNSTVPAKEILNIENGEMSINLQRGNGIECKDKYNIYKQAD